MRATEISRALRLALPVVVASLWGCTHDPVIAERIEKLPAEDAAGASAFHRAGQPCVDCHNTYEGASPELAVGGTIFSQNPDLTLKGVSGVFVTIFESAGATSKSCTNAAGNFYITKADLQGVADFAFPLTVQVGSRFMSSLVGRERSCAGCHVLANEERIAEDPSVDKATGQGRSSAGAILISFDEIPESERCGPLVDPTGSGGGGASGTGAGGATVASTTAATTGAGGSGGGQ